MLCASERTHQGGTGNAEEPPSSASGGASDVSTATPVVRLESQIEALVSKRFSSYSLLHRQHLYRERHIAEPGDLSTNDILKTAATTLGMAHATFHQK
jgi:hypothetical protein